MTYTITVTDTGQTPYTGAVVTDDLTGLLDDAAYGADAAATSGVVSYASPVLTWTGNLTPGQAATITYTVTVDNPETGDNILTNTVTSAAPGSNCRDRIHRPPLRQHRPGGHADHRQHRERVHRHPRIHGSTTPSPSPTPGRSATTAPPSPTR